MFPPGDDHFFSGAQPGQHEKDRPGVVVHHQPRIGTGDFFQEPFHVITPVPPLAFGNVVFEGTVPVGHGQNRVPGLGGQA